MSTGLFSQDDVAYTSKDLIQSAFPYHMPVSGDLTRVLNQENALRIEAMPRVGLPYGKFPRLFLVWLTSQCVRNYADGLAGKDAVTIHFGSSRRLMEKLGLSCGRSSIAQFNDQLRRVRNLTICFENNDQKTTQQRGWFLLDRVELYSGNKDFEPAETTELRRYPLFESYVVVSQEFFDLIVETPVPVRWSVVTSLKRFLALDVYLFLARLAVCEVRDFSWPELKLIFGQKYVNTSLGLANFRTSFRLALGNVQSCWPELVCVLDKRGLHFDYLPPAVPMQNDVLKALNESYTE